MRRALAKLLPVFVPAAIGATITVGAGIFTFGQQLGHAEATAAYWREYHEAMSKACR